ncbi:MAG: CTP synthase [Myxococcota bacterium]
MNAAAPKIIFVSGGVLSSVGKGIVSASIGALCESMGLRVSILKMDPYLNVDPGTMNPFQHGEVFVTDDGAETDLDLGHYERFLSGRLSKRNSTTSGQIYQRVFDRERRGDYLGATVQVIPHVTDTIKQAIHDAAAQCDLLICEVGGTVGDIESQPFMEAIRQMRQQLGWANVLSMHVSHVPYIDSAGELKTKPTQHSVKELLTSGIQPDVIVLRAKQPVPQEIKNKIALFCNVDTKAVINCPDVATVYRVPLVLEQEQLHTLLLQRLQLTASKPLDLQPWQQVVQRFCNPQREVHVGIVGKYTGLVESYKSIHEALVHAGIAHKARVRFCYVDSDQLSPDTVQAQLQQLDAVLVAPGFGERGAEGKMCAVTWARQHNVPFLGICLGMQMAVIEFARHVAHIAHATSTELDPNAQYPVVHLMPLQRGICKKGGTMRLGSYPCVLQPNSLAAKVYGSTEIHERHRHRYEFNNAYREQLQQAGLVLCGLSPDQQLVEMIELPNHPFFIGCQFHPEFLSKPLAPHPLFTAFVGAACQRVSCAC